MKTHLSDMLDTLARRLADTLAPRGCAVCGCRLCLQEQAVCSACNISIPRTHYARNPFDNDMAKVFWHLAPIEKAAAWFFYNAGSPTAFPMLPKPMMPSVFPASSVWGVSQ